MGHHVLGGQCNYNVCCPMTDHLLGTYVPSSEWQTKMRPVPANVVVRGSVVAPQSFGGVPQLPTLEEYARAKAQNSEKGVVTPRAIAKGGTIIAD
eukprot:2360374-Prymnesium_polylepis.2